MLKKHMTPLLLACALSLVARPAAATPNFPSAIQQTLTLAAAPDCSICHSDGDQGGKGTVTTPFGKNMRARGLVEFDVGSLNTALTQMESDHVDSIGDCLDDIDELKAGRDPNVPDPPNTCPEDGGATAAPPSETPPPESPTYGCVGQVAPVRSPHVPIFLLSFVAACVALRRRRGRSIPHP
jgi:hypothetical protein